VSDDIDLRRIVADVAAAYFGNSHVTPSDIPMVINQIAVSLSAVGASTPEAAPKIESEPKLTPAQIRKSITDDALISFEDSKPYKTLRRHLAVRGLSPDEYRAKWGLPRDYPMVAPSYSEARARMARSIGLGGRIAAKSAASTSAAAPAKGAARKQAAAAGIGADGRRRAAPRVVAAAKVPSEAEAPRRGPGRPRKAKEPA
jgi:predicted transcriptional regulator